MPKAVLVVDDDPFQRKVIGAWLLEAGWPVLEAAEADTALARAGEAGIMLVDLRLGDTDGCDLARRVARQALQPAPVLVAMSADVTESVRWRCRRAGFVHTLSKPFQRPALLHLLETVGSATTRAPTPVDAPEDARMSQVPPSLRDVPALAALWRLEQTSSEPELQPVVAGLHQAGQLLLSAADETDQAEAATAARTLAATAHGLAGAAGILGCKRVEATSKALASRVRHSGLDDEARLLVTVISGELETALRDLARRIEAANRPE